ncbi:hypothetical protein ACFL0Y_01370 [Patescibacteria group bacterium]
MNKYKERQGMKKIFIGVLLGSLLATIVFGLYFNFQKKREISDDEKLLSRYPNGFVTKSIKIDDSIITFSFDNPGWENTDIPNYNSPPIAYLIGDDFSEQVYEIDFETMGITQNVHFLRIDVDADGKDEIISEWGGHSMGGGGLKGLVVWKLDKNKNLIPFAGYPQGKNEESSFTIKNFEANETLTFPEINWDCFTDYQSDTSGFKLSLACYIWDLNIGESRGSPHVWKLQVFNFEDGQFTKDKSWNNGEDYLTKEKITTDDAGYQKIREIFYSL